MSAPRPRGRPRRFDEEEVLGRALEAFWSKGYAACSVDDLATAAGVSRPSLYAAFHDKQTLYLRALDRFAAALEVALAASFAPERSLAEGLACFYRAGLDRYLSGEHGPRGCLVFCTATAEAVETPAIREALARVLARLDEVLAAQFARAADRGALPPGADPRSSARLAAAVLHSLAVRARAGEADAALRAMADDAVQLLARSPSEVGDRERRGR